MSGQDEVTNSDGSMKKVNRMPGGNSPARSGGKYSSSTTTLSAGGRRLREILTLLLTLAKRFKIGSRNAGSLSLAVSVVTLILLLEHIGKEPMMHDSLLGWLVQLLRWLLGWLAGTTSQ